VDAESILWWGSKGKVTGSGAALRVIVEAEVDEGQALRGGELHQLAERGQEGARLPTLQWLGGEIPILALRLAAGGADVHSAIHAPDADLTRALVHAFISARGLTCASSWLDWGARGSAALHLKSQPRGRR
jgi:hypothetical protein